MRCYDIHDNNNKPNCQNLDELKILLTPASKEDHNWLSRNENMLKDKLVTVTAVLLNSLIMMIRSSFKTLANALKKCLNV